MVSKSDHKGALSGGPLSSWLRNQEETIGRRFRRKKPIDLLVTASKFVEEGGKNPATCGPL